MVTFNCSADGNPPVDTYQLLENGVPVRESSSSHAMWSRNISTVGVFDYKCMANNSVGTAYSMNLTVSLNGKQQIQNYLLWILQYNVICGVFNFMFSLFDVISYMKYAINKLGIVSISVIHVDKVEVAALWAGNFSLRNIAVTYQWLWVVVDHFFSFVTW